MIVDNVTLPKWIFENIHHSCNKFLVTINPDGTSNVDGCHGDEQSVAKAKKLIESISIIRPKPGAFHVMITVEKVPELKKDDINYEAVDTLNHMAATNAKRRKENETKSIAHHPRDLHIRNPR
jgi:hypothetical protein